MWTSIVPVLLELVLPMDMPALLLLADQVPDSAIPPNYVLEAQYLAPPIALLQQMDNLAMIAVFVVIRAYAIMDYVKE